MESSPLLFQTRRPLGVKRCDVTGDEFSTPFSGKSGAINVGYGAYADQLL